jgi:hypothetical protein
MLKKSSVIIIFLLGFAYSQGKTNEMPPEKTESVEIVWSDNTINQLPTKPEKVSVSAENLTTLPVNDNATGIDPVNPPSAEFLDNASSGTYTTCTCCTILLIVYLITALL